MRKSAIFITAFIVALFLAAIVAAATVGFMMEHGLGLASEISCALARIAVALVILAVFRKLFCFRRSFSGICYAMPLLFAVWNVANSLMRGESFVGVGGLPEAIVLGLAPGIFEEVVFRGVLIGKLLDAGKGMMSALVISAGVFGAVHLTNAIGSGMAQALVQTCYSVVVGLAFGAVYIVSRDIVTVVLFHVLTDICYYVFSRDAGTPLVMAVVFFAFMALEAFWGVWLVRRAQACAGSRPSPWHES